MQVVFDNFKLFHIVHTFPFNLCFWRGVCARPVFSGKQIMGVLTHLFLWQSRSWSPLAEEQSPWERWQSGLLGCLTGLSVGGLQRLQHAHTDTFRYYKWKAAANTKWKKNGQQGYERRDGHRKSYIVSVLNKQLHACIYGMWICISRAQAQCQTAVTCVATRAQDCDVWERRVVCTIRTNLYTYTYFHISSYSAVYLHFIYNCVKVLSGKRDYQHPAALCCGHKYTNIQYRRKPLNHISYTFCSDTAALPWQLYLEEVNATCIVFFFSVRDNVFIFYVSANILPTFSALIPSTKVSLRYG